MNTCSNFHTHTTFCDGKNTVEENAIEAEKRGLCALGFSSHAMLPFSDSWHLKTEKVSEYCDSVRLSAKHHPSLAIRLGFEADFIPDFTFPTFEHYAEFSPDFLIGSVHFVYNNRGIFEADDSFESVLGGIKKLYNGNVQAAVERYFEQQREMLQTGDFSIIAHADLIRKPNERGHFFREDESWYRTQLRLTADAIKRAGVAAEINTGGIARKRLSSPYPSKEFLSLLFERNVPITISSDAHESWQIDCAFEEARKLARSVGYRETIVDFPQKGQFVFAPL